MNAETGTADVGQQAFEPLQASRIFWSSLAFVWVLPPLSGNAPWAFQYVSAAWQNV